MEYIDPQIEEQIVKLNIMEGHTYQSLSDKFGFTYHEIRKIIADYKKSAKDDAERAMQIEYMKKYRRLMKEKEKLKKENDLLKKATENFAEESGEQKEMRRLPITVKIIKSERKTIYLDVRQEGVVLKAPIQMSDDEIHEFLENKREWIEKAIIKVDKRWEQIKNADHFTLEELQALADKALIVIPEKVEHYAKIIGVDFGDITIRCQRTRWGSCSSKGNLSFNCLLMELPDEIIDSVVVHELCHRKYMNHSPQFYAEVEKAFPDYQRCRKWLKEHGESVLIRIPLR